MIEYSLPGFQEMTLSIRKSKIMHLELEFWSVQIITGHVFYNSRYNILTDESTLSVVTFDHKVQGEATIP